MENIRVLDCTLRDGGYCNEWRFGYNNIKKIISGLVKSNIDIIECGFITNCDRYDSDVTKFTKLEQISEVIPNKHEGKMFVAMMNYGDYDSNVLPANNGTSIDGIRVAFHKKNVKEALDVCEKIKDKGYLVFIQAMVTLSYSDVEFLAMINRVNRLEPYAFYIVDSFGEMKGQDLTRLFYLVEHNLKKNIRIGFHSHNNMQLAYSNAQTLVDMHSTHELIIDSSVYGMGRGAGNLNTELLVEYLNDNAHGRYNLRPLLNIIDEVLNEFYQRNYWGYSLPNYISAVYHTHPNYAGYLDDKKTLTIENMVAIFDMMDNEKRVSYDKAYIEELYFKYMMADKTQGEHEAEIGEILKDKIVLLIAPGKSAVEEKEKIKAFAGRDDVATISVNYEYPYTDVDFVFLSNFRRYRELEDKSKAKCIVTSNIPAEGVYLQTKYSNLLSSNEAVKDNAGLMAIRFIMSLGVKDVYLAGFDGYTHDIGDNYGDSNMAFVTKNAVLDAMNKGMIKVLKQYAKEINIVFLTSPKHVGIETEDTADTRQYRP